MVGIVTEVTSEKSTNNFAINIKSTADFYNLQYVYVIDNLQQAAINDLLNKAEKKSQ